LDGLFGTKDTKGERTSFERVGGLSFAHPLSRKQVKALMNKRERISQWLAEATGEDVNHPDVESHPYYCVFFRCWNEQRYYEAHDVLEQLWLNTKSSDSDFFSVRSSAKAL
jgi:hypothetical protein